MISVYLLSKMMASYIRVTTHKTRATMLITSLMTWAFHIFMVVQRTLMGPQYAKQLYQSRLYRIYIALHISKELR
jgi:hypothetical protein